MNALSSLNKSLKSYVKNSYGLGEIIIYTDMVTGTEYSGTPEDPLKAIREYKETDSRNREISSDEITDQMIFLMELEIKPKRNDKIEYENNEYFVEYYEIVTDEMYRIFTSANTQAVPGTDPRHEL